MPRQKHPDHLPKFSTEKASVDDAVAKLR